MNEKNFRRRLVRAIQSGKEAEVKRLLEWKVRKSSRIETCWRFLICRPRNTAIPLSIQRKAIMAACTLESATILEYILEMLDTSVNFTFKTQSQMKGEDTPLHTAVSKGLHRTMEVLAAANADINRYDSRGRTALHIAVWHCDCRALRILLQRGGDTTKPTLSGETALQIASKYGHVELVRILLESRVQIFQENQKGPSPLHIAAGEGHVPLIDIFSRYVDINTKSACPSGVELTALHIAAGGGYIETVRYMVDNFGASVNKLDSLNQTALHYAVMNKHSYQHTRCIEDFEQVAFFLVSRHIDVNQQNDEGDTALHLAAKNSFHRIVEMLIVNGGNVHILNSSNKVPVECIPQFDAPTRQVFDKYTPIPYEHVVNGDEVKAKDTLNSEGIVATTEAKDDYISLNKIKCAKMLNQNTVVKGHFNKIPLKTCSAKSQDSGQGKMVLSDGRTIFHKVLK